VGNGSTTGAISGNVVDNALLKFNRSDSLAFSGGISGTGTVTHAGSGTLVLSGASSYAGATTVNGGGILSVGSSSNLGSSSNTLVLDNGTLKTTGGFSSSRKITIGASGGTINSNGFDTSWGDLDPGNFTKTGTGKVSVRSLNALAVTVSGGTLAVKDRATTGGNQPARMISLNLGPTGSETGILDLNDNDLVVNYTGSSPWSTINQYVLDGFSGTGGITSSVRANAPGGSPAAATILITFDNNDAGGAITEWPPASGITVDTTTVIGKYTYLGDVNLDGQVTGDDISIVNSLMGTDLSASNTPQSLWWQLGDVNFDGLVTGDDYSQVSSFLGDGLGSPLTSATSATSALTTVPEPQVLALAAMAMLTTRRRRKRQPDDQPCARAE
jgi:autotransporter-associated beta strand protein